MKKLILSIALLISTLVAANAATIVGSNLAPTNFPWVVDQPIVLVNLTMFSSNTVPTTVRLYDGNVVYTNTAYSNYVTYVTNIVVTHTNSTGLTNNFTNTTIYGEFQAVAASTNNARTPSATLIVPANNVPITYNAPLSLIRGLSISNNLQGLSYVINYRLP